MKRIAFIGTIANSQRSSQIFNLYNESRIYNSEHNIKGVFLVYKNTVFQVLEGDGAEVGKAVYYARRGDNFDYFGIVVNRDIDRASFHTWPMRFVKNDSPSHVAFLQKLNHALKDQLQFNNDEERELYDSIFNRKGVVSPIPIARKPATDTAQPGAQGAFQNAPAPPSSYRNTALSLSAWPKTTQMRNTPQVIKTCSLLSRGTVAYQTLLAKELWSAETDLVEFLNRLHQWGLLVITQGTAEPSAPAPQGSGDRFSQLLKKFIQSPKHHVN